MIKFRKFFSVIKAIGKCLVAVAEVFATAVAIVTAVKSNKSSTVAAQS